MKLIHEQKELFGDEEEQENLLKLDDLLKYMGNVKVEVLKEELCKILEDYDVKF